MLYSKQKYNLHVHYTESNKLKTGMSYIQGCLYAFSIIAIMLKMVWTMGVLKKKFQCMYAAPKVEDTTASLHNLFTRNKP